MRRLKLRTTLVAIGLVLGLVLSVAACSSSSSSPSASSSSSSSPAAAPPELVPVDQAAMQADFDKTVDGELIPGAVALVRTPAGSYTPTHGTTTLGADIRPSPTDYCRIGSVTKTMVAAVVLQLVQEGRLGVEDPIDRYVPGVPNGPNITVSDLLDVRSGLHNYLDTVGFDTGFNQNPTRVWAPHELLALAYAEPPSFPPGTAFEYSNSNTILLGLLVEKLAGKPLSAVLSQRLFAPLGMTHTSLPEATPQRFRTPPPGATSTGDSRWPT